MYLRELVCPLFCEDCDFSNVGQHETNRKFAIADLRSSFIAVKATGRSDLVIISISSLSGEVWGRSNYIMGDLIGLREVRIGMLVFSFQT